jgi:DNA-binding winged helix-turn-helix (wHTH) protein/TolB-like protein/Tfp pilus assembly protein PilF
VTQHLPEDFGVGDWRIRPADNALYRDGARLQLEPKVMALLVHLAAAAGHTLSREQLFQAVWPGVVVGDDTLTQAVIKLRKALGDSAKHPRYIQTVPKRGYRLVAPLHLSSPGTCGPPKQRRPWAWAAALSALALAGLLLALLLLPEPAPENTPHPTPEAEDGDGLPTLTVQPFVPVGGGEGGAYLAQGLTLDLITDLSGLSGLWVIGSRSIMGQKSENDGPPTARYRVAGEVQRDQERIRVHVHLLDGRDGRQLWSERYKRPFDNLFQLQEEISRRIARALSVKVGEEELRRLAHRYTRNVTAYERFLQAQSLLLVRSRAENLKARQLYRQAIDLDPSFGRAYGGLALSYAADYRNQWAADDADPLERARSMARTALQIDPEIPEVYWVLAYVDAQQRRHEQALSLLRKAVSLDRSFADAYALMGGINTYMGHPEETPGLIRTAISLNPEAGYLYYLLLGRAYFFLRDWEQALINLREALARNPAHLEGHVYLAAVLESSGDHGSAAWEWEEILALQGDFSAAAWLQTYPMSDAAQSRALLDALAAAHDATR